MELENVEETLFILGLMQCGLAYVWKNYCGNPSASLYRSHTNLWSHLHEVVEKYKSGYPSHSVATQILCYVECTSTTLFTIFRTNCFPCILIMPGKSDACTDKKPRDRRKKERGITLRESGGVREFGQANVYWCFAHKCCVSESMICFVKKMTMRSGEGLTF